MNCYSLTSFMCLLEGKHLPCLLYITSSMSSLRLELGYCRRYSLHRPQTLQICKQVNLIIQCSAFLSKELISFPIPLSSPYSRMHISSGLSIITLVDRFDTCNYMSRVNNNSVVIPYKMQYKATRLLELTPDFGFGGNALHPPSSNI